MPAGIVRPSRMVPREKTEEAGGEAERPWEKERGKEGESGKRMFQF